MNGLLDELLNSFEREEDGLEVYYNYYGNVKPSDARAELAALRAESESRRVALEQKAEEVRREWIRAENAEAALEEAKKVIAPFAHRNKEFMFIAMGMAAIDFALLRAAEEWQEKYGDK